MPKLSVIEVLVLSGKPGQRQRLGGFCRPSSLRRTERYHRWESGRHLWSLAQSSAGLSLSKSWTQVNPSDGLVSRPQGDSRPPELLRATVAADKLPASELPNGPVGAGWRESCSLITPTRCSRTSELLSRLSVTKAVEVFQTLSLWSRRNTSKMISTSFSATSAAHETEGDVSVRRHHEARTKERLQ